MRYNWIDEDERVCFMKTVSLPLRQFPSLWTQYIEWSLLRTIWDKLCPEIVQCLAIPLLRRTCRLIVLVGTTRAHKLMMR